MRAPLVAAVGHGIISAMKKVLFLVIFCALIFFAFKGARLFFGGRVLSFEGEKLLKINENGLVFAAQIKSKTVEDLLREQKITLGEKDLVFPQKSAKTLPGMTVEIRRAVPVTIIADDQTISYFTFKSSVEEALGEAGIELSRLDKVKPERDKGVESGMEIEVTRINIEKITEEEKISFETVEKNDPKLKWRKKEVEQEGVDGIKEVSYEVTYKNGKQVSKEKLSSKIIQQPVDEIVKIGTKVEVGKSKVGIASWYAHTGTMACASRMFPRGTWLRVTNRENGKQVFVVVNDFGPQQGTGKMIDLDKVAFAKLASIGKGVIEVKVEEILE